MYILSKIGYLLLKPFLNNLSLVFFLLEKTQRVKHHSIIWICLTFHLFAIGIAYIYIWFI